MTDEIWRDISGYEGIYKVSNIGEVLSLRSRGRCFSKRKIIKPQYVHGTWSVSLHKDCKQTTHPVSHLVVQAFQYPELDLSDIKTVYYLDGDRRNCSVDNLSANICPSALSKLQHRMEG